ncbi:bifunctional diguanylate cyclase/phosphodiesterase [Antrihabitans sp. YC2-6]|uniref:putative bifunctional diguanylate cyclase/phosphodiesterase n=1 Tax=Antrihabitans sp. YC2-6 TaxID=2799498 RepID=UPI001A33320B|nr:EAL domain-containing protein [Antrihabitans sp. YC2-6]MBJ8348625.1 EAL domain-containing protein [Antrihabitans sp. YC2-6]
MVRGSTEQRLAAWSTAFASVGAIATIALTILGTSVGYIVPMLVVVSVLALASAIAMVVGIKANQPVDALPWRVIVVSNGIAGLALSMWFVDLPTIAPALRALGFGPLFLTGLAAVFWLRREGGPSIPKVALDATLVALGTALAGWAAFVTPVIERTGNAFDAPLLRLACLALDAAAFMVVVHLCIAKGLSNRAYILVAAAVVATATAVALLLASKAFPQSVDPAAVLYVLPFAFCCYAAATLHPSMAQPAASIAAHVDRFWGRFTVVATVLTISVLMAVIFQPVGQVDRLTRLALFATLFMTVLIRSEYAVEASERGKAEARARANHDDLTGLPNRAALYVDLTSARVSDSGCCLHFMDLNDFKLVNDSFGHRVGDELISLVAERVVAAVGDAGTVYRYGGDEFVIASWSMDRCACTVPDETPSTASCGGDPSKTVADEILTAMKQPFELSVGRVFISTSIGISFTKPGSIPNVDDLIREADSAMYHVKATEPGGYAMFDDKLRAIAVSELAMTGALRGAVEGEEFELYYQPIVELATGETVAYEALLRWHLDGRLVGPAEFMRFAESSDLIVEIGEWVLRSACRQLAQWRADRPSLRIAVNVSARQLRGRAILEYVRDALQENGLPGSALWLELTETALIEDHPSALGLLNDLVSMGVTICIDDFGTGYSALGNLQRFPIEIVKIDKSFIEAAERDRRMFVLASAIEVLAEALELSSVAEGVENAAQEARVRAIGCTYAQGWYYGAPVAAAAVTRANDLAKELATGSEN